VNLQRIARRLTHRNLSIKFAAVSLARQLFRHGLKLAAFAELVRMDFPEDLGQRIVEATRLAVMLHIQNSLGLEFIPGGTGREIGGVGLFGGAATDGGDITPPSALDFSADALAEDGPSAAESEAA
jgi:hypothetical protein